MATLNRSILHRIAQCLPDFFTHAKRAAHTPPRSFVQGAPCSYLNTQQLSILFDPIVFVLHQVNDRLVILSHFLRVSFVEVFFTGTCQFKYDDSLCFH